MRYLTRRMVFYLAAAFFAITINFAIPRLMTGNPVQLLIARFQGRLDPRAEASLYETFGFVSGPVHEQYITYMRNLLAGNLGISVAWYPAPVSSVIATGLGWTLRLVGVATILSFTIGIMLGIFAAWRRGKFVDSVVLPISTILSSFPYFWLALLILYVFGFNLKWFPLNHAYDLHNLSEDWTNPAFLLSVVYHAFLPATTILITSVGGWMLGMRNNMINVLSEDYITMAQAKGLSDRRVMLTYAARNAILPSLTGFAMSLGFILGGALLTEIVFSYPGIGYTLLTAVNARDYPVMQAVFLMITFSVLGANLIADTAYVLLDPRARS
jgi:peptide/nickel transport system permease protein